MKEKLLTTLIILLAATFIKAQENWNQPTKADYPPIKRSGNTINSFVPRNWKIIGKAFGDLNKDRKSDAVLVLRGNFAKFKNKNEEGLGRNIFDTNPQILVILFKNKIGKGYRLAEQNNRFIIQANSPTMSEPFQKVSIKRNVIKFDFENWYSAGSWSAFYVSYKFRYQNGRFVLIGADKTSRIRNTGEEELRSYNFLTRKRQMVKTNPETEKKKVSWKRIKLETLPTLKTIIPFQWEVEYDYWI